MKYIFLVALASSGLAALCEPQVSLTESHQQDGESETAGQPKGPTYAGSAEAVDCLNAFNEARNAAGLASFISAGEEFRVKNLADTNKQFISNVCQALMTQEPLTPTETGFNRTIALAIQDGENGDCAAAVTHFNGALSLFGDLPPAFSTDPGSVYKKLQAVSFVALYNPGEDPKLDCGYFTCTKSETTTTTPSTTQKGIQKASADPVTQTVTATLHGLLCATSPPALIDGQAPFDQDQFDKIKEAINSASAAVPALSTLAVAIAGFTLFN